MVVEETEAAYRRSAAPLRACGQEDQARRAERFAAAGLRKPGREVAPGLDHRTVRSYVSDCG
jgi:hypothetical protein